MKKLINPLPFQPGEASWASWKCRGGVHADAHEMHPVIAEHTTSGDPASTKCSPSRVDVERAKLFPHTPSGIRAAIDITPPDGYWEEKVDLTSDFQPDHADQRSVLAAIVQTVASSPELFNDAAMGEISRATQAYGLT